MLRGPSLLSSSAPSHQELHQVVASWGCKGGCCHFCHFEGGPLQQPARRRACVPPGRTPVGPQCCSEAHLQPDDHVTRLLRDVLRWLPVPFRIEYKLCLLVFLSLHGAAPEYLRDCCIVTHSSASGLRLRSLEKTDLRVRRMRTPFRDRAFSAAGPQCWNSLPPAIRLADSVDSFKVQLKTYLFAKAYPV